MPQSVARSLTAHLLDRCPPTRAYTASDIAHAPMPATIAHFLRYDLGQRVQMQLDAWSLDADVWTDAEHPEVQATLRQLKAAAQRQAAIPGKAWEEAVRHAVDRVLYHLVDPEGTLMSFLSADADEPITAESIKQRIGYFSAYGYFGEVLSAYLADRGVAQLDRTRLANLLRRIDLKMTGDYEPERWVRLLKPLRDTLQPIAPGTAIPAGLLKAFFDAKGYRALAQPFATMRPDAWVEEEQLLTLLTNAPSAGADGAVAPVEEPPSAQVGDSPVPLWKQFQKQTPPKVEAKPPSGPPPRWKQFQQPNGTPPVATETEATSPVGVPAVRAEPASSAAELSALEQAVFGERGAKNRALFVENLFEGSPASYEEVLQQLRGAPSWQEASRIIAQEVFRKNRVNIYSEPAVAFTDAIEARYRDSRS